MTFYSDMVRQKLDVTDNRLQRPNAMVFASMMTIVAAAREAIPEMTLVMYHGVVD